MDHRATDSGFGLIKSTGDGFMTVELPFKIVRRGGGTRIMLASDRSPTFEASATALVKALVRGYRWRQRY